MPGGIWGFPGGMPGGFHDRGPGGFSSGMLGGFPRSVSGGIPGNIDYNKILKILNVIIILSIAEFVQITR